MQPKSVQTCPNSAAPTWHLPSPYPAHDFFLGSLTWNLFFLPNVGFRESTYSHTRESLLTCQCVGECLAQWCTRNTGCICKASGLAQYYRGILAATPESHPFEGVSELVWEKHPIWSNSSYQFVTYSLQHTNFIVGLDSLYDPVCFLLFLHHSYSWPSWQGFWATSGTKTWTMASDLKVSFD